MSTLGAQQAWSHEEVEKIRGVWQRYDAQLIVAASSGAARGKPYCVRGILPLNNRCSCLIGDLKE